MALSFFLSSLRLCVYRAFHVFEQAKFAYGGSIFGSSQFTIRVLGKTSFKLRASEKNTLKATIKLYTNRVCVITFQLMYFKFPK